MSDVHYAFMFLGFVITLFNARVLWALRQRMMLAFPSHGKVAAAVLITTCLVLLSPALALAFGGLSALRAFRDETPIWLAITCMTLQFAIWMYGLSLAFVTVPADIVLRWRKLRRKLGTLPATPNELPSDMQRRRAMQRAALSLPVAIVATSSLGAAASQDEPKIGRIALPLRPDYRALDGITVAQFSDVHVGSYMSARRLSVLRDTLKSLRPDIIVCTGDLLDNHPDQLGQATELLRSLSAPRGVYMCMGNHDYIAAMSTTDSNVANITKPLRETGVDLLIAQTRKIAVNGSHLWLMGTDYPDMPGLPAMLRRSTKQSLDSCLAEVKDDAAPRIIMAHTPSQFNDGKQREIDLMLSGHTHGGQISLGRIGDYNLSPVLPFEHYHRGLYEHEGRRLYVNSGYGGWLPIRVNCPPEITLVTFQA